MSSREIQDDGIIQRGQKRRGVELAADNQAGVVQKMPEISQQTKKPLSTYYFKAVGTFFITFL